MIAVWVFKYIGFAASLAARWRSRRLEFISGLSGTESVSWLQAKKLAARIHDRHLGAVEWVLIFWVVAHHDDFGGVEVEFVAAFGRLFTGLPRHFVARNDGVGLLHVCSQ